MRLLVVEDFSLLRDSLVLGLRDAGYAVDEARDGATGKRMALTIAYDLVVLDIMLPGVDGLTILQALRQTGSTASVLLLTARDAPADRVRGLDMGADDYLVKPFEFGEFMARVRALLRRRYDQKSPVMKIGDLAIDTAARRVSRGEATIDLTAREYSLLSYMAMRRGEVITRTDIWEHVYDENANAQSNVVDVFIGHLRRKIERNNSPRLIHTRRGLGYVLEELA
jgi:two-component system copper resistance phosphate regulon response regulator CusR